MNARKSVIGSMVILSIAAIVMVGMGEANGTVSLSEEGLAIGQPAPSFTLTNHDGKEVSLSDFEDKIVVLEWFNPQCPYVKLHHVDNTTMVDLAKKYGEKEVVWLAINSSHFADNDFNKKWAEKWDLPYAVLNDQTGDIGKAYGARTTPHMFIIDAEGKLAYQGAIDDDPRGRSDDPNNYVAKALDELLSDQTVSIPETRPYGCSVKYKK